MKKIFSALVIIFFAICSSAQVTTVPISQLPTATVPLSGAELVPLVQNGVTKKTPASSFISWAVSQQYFDSVITDIINNTVKYIDTPGLWMSQQVLLDTCILQDSIWTCFYTDGSVRTDTIRGFLSTNNLDTLKDSLIVDTQIFNGTDSLGAIRHSPRSTLDTLRLRIPESDPTHDGYMPKEAWAYIDSVAAASGGGGTVTNFSAGDLSPLFTTTETNTTTTPALSFTQSNTTQYTVLGRKASGSGAYSFLTADSSLIPDLHSEGYYDTKYQTIGGSGTETKRLDTATSEYHNTTKPLVSADSVQSYSFFSNGGAVFSDSTILTTDSIIVYGASVEVGTGITGGGTRWSTLVATKIGAVEVNKAIAGTTFQKRTNGDSSFIDRLYTVPVYRTTERFIFIGASNFINSDNQNIGASDAATELARAIDTIHLARGWPLSKIVVVTPNVYGTSGSISRDTGAYYSNIVVQTARLKGVPYVDVWNYMLNNGNTTLINSDSSHPNNSGAYQFSEGVIYRISDVKINNSLRVQRDFLAKGDASIGDKLTMVNTTAGTVGNFSGVLNYGTTVAAGGSAPNGNAITLFDNASTTTRAGLGFTTALGTMYMFNRVGDTSLMFGSGFDATNMKSANASFFLTNTYVTPVSTGSPVVFNGSTYFFNAKPTNITFKAAAGTAGNSINVINYGNGGNGVDQGIYIYDGGSTALRGGLIYDRAGTNNTALFARGSTNFNFGIGLDESNMTILNSAFYIDSVTNRVKFQSGTTSVPSFFIKEGVKLTTGVSGAVSYDTASSKRRLLFTNNSLIAQEIPLITQSRVSTQFDKTSNTTLADITGLTANVAAGQTYRFEATLYTSSNSGGGVQFAIAGTSTATNIIYEGLTTDAGVTTQSRATALATAVGAVTAVTAAYTKITGTITVNAAGTLTVQFAQNASNGTASSVLVGSTFVVTQVQ